MKIHDVKQGDEAWLKLRAEKLTASEASALLTPLFKVKDGKAVQTLVSRKLSERWLGTPLPDEDDFKSLPVEWGKILEIEAKPNFKLMTDLEIRNVGFMESDDGACGCSPDAVGDGFGLEVKCPAMPNHVRYLLENEVPDAYKVQVHFSMYVSGFSRWYFMSYRQMMPPLILTVERDQKIQDQIAEAVESFKAKMDAGWARLVELNGGREPERHKSVDEFRAEHESDDIIL
jgi:hypothetical protein